MHGEFVVEGISDVQQFPMFVIITPRSSSIGIYVSVVQNSMFSLIRISYDLVNQIAYVLVDQISYCH